MFNNLAARIPWLNPQNPMVARELRHVNRTLPKLIQKLSDPWTMFGYAALIHGTLFALSLVTYNRSVGGTPQFLLPFLTPFGTPVAAAILHSLLYWAMLIGVAKYTVQIVGRDVETGTWSILNTTPVAPTAILSAKMGISLYVWGKVLRSLLITRAVVLLIVPIAIVLQQQDDKARLFISSDFLNGAVFLVQPLVDAFLIASLSALVALIVPNAAWARVGSYAASALVYGGINAIGALWLLYNSTMGAFAGLFAPLGHWAPLAAGIVKPQSLNEFSYRVVAIGVIYIVLPLIAGTCALMAARWKSRQFMV